MTRPIILRRLAAAALLAAAPSHLLAATPAADSSAAVDVLRALSLQKLEDMEFGNVVVAGAGTAVIDPATNSMTTTGGVTALSGPRTRGGLEARLRAARSSLVRVPRDPVTLTRVGGTETLT